MRKLVNATPLRRLALQAEIAAQEQANADRFHRDEQTQPAVEIFEETRMVAMASSDLTTGIVHEVGLLTPSQQLVDPALVAAAARAWSNNTVRAFLSDLTLCVAARNDDRPELQ